MFCMVRNQSRAQQPIPISLCETHFATGDEMDYSLCVGQRCGRRPNLTRTRHVAAAGSRLCGDCGHDLRASLLELPGIYADCESALLPRRNSSLQRVSGSRHTSGILIDDEAITTRSSILSFLASWSALVADERAVAKPARRDPGELTKFLVKHLSWLLAHPAAGDLAEEVGQLTAHARRSADTPPALRLELGECIHPNCDATMSTASGGREGRRSREVRCAAGHAWQPHQWLRLFHQIQQTRHHRETTRAERAGESL
jgi:hypothetical protein